MEAIVIKSIPYRSKYYMLSLEIRDRILKSTIDGCIFDDDLKEEAEQFHIAAFNGDEIVGTTVVKAETDHLARIRQVAVEPFMQGHNVGRRLVYYAEHLAWEHGFDSVILMARKTAVGFYAKMGYKVINEEELNSDSFYVDMGKRIGDRQY